MNAAVAVNREEHSLPSMESISDLSRVHGEYKKRRITSKGKKENKFNSTVLAVI
jgi:hypothetical protein